MKTEKIENQNFKGTLRNDDVYVKSEVKSLSSLTGISSRKGLENVIISDGQIVNVVSDSYGHLPNEKFFPELEVKLIDANINYVTRSINRDNRSFAVDYILSDENYVVKVKSGNDRIKPMLRLTNSYDGSNRTSGHFGFFREVCQNGLHVAESKIGFRVKHRGNIAQVVIPEMKALVAMFIDNEFYSLHKKFEVLAEKPIKDLSDFVKVTATSLNLFQYAASEKNQSPSLNARTVIETIEREAYALKEQPNYWLGYNAFNEILHGKFKKTFEAQKNMDEKIFEYLVEA